MNKEKTLVVDNIQSLEELISSVKEAQRIFSTYSQEQVDKIFTAAALAANKARIPLAKMAVKETGMGIVEDKVINGITVFPQKFPYLPSVTINRKIKLYRLQNPV